MPSVGGSGNVGVNRVPYFKKLCSLRITEAAAIAMLVTLAQSIEQEKSSFSRL